MDEEAVARMLEGALEAHGLKNAPAVVRRLETLQAVVAGDPIAKFPEEAFTRLVTQFREPLSAESREKAAMQDHVAAVRERELLAVAPVTRDRGMDLNAFLPKKERMQGTSRYLHVVEEVIRLLKGG
jgi:uncharacterized protein (DUF1697 family)